MQAARRPCGPPTVGCCVSPSLIARPQGSQLLEWFEHSTLGSNSAEFVEANVKARQVADLRTGSMFDRNSIST
jgi:hypothetical protein